MPWTPADATEHTKAANTERKREIWAEVANGALQRCLDKDGEQDECEASAIRQANAAVAQIGEQEPSGPETCVCPDCGYETDKERGTPCRSMECPECGATLVAGTEQTTSGENDVNYLRADNVTSGTNWTITTNAPDTVIYVEAATIKSKVQRLARDIEAILGDRSLPSALRKEIEDVRRALRRTWSDLGNEADGEEEEQEKMPELAEAVTKTVDGKQYPASDFLVVEDPESPSTWHLQVKRNGTPDTRLMGGAKAALTSPGGHRGRKYEGPSKQEAIRKLKALYKSEDLEWSEVADGILPTLRELLAQALTLLDDGEPIAEAGTVPLAESAAGHAVGLKESDDGSGTLYLDFVPISAGWGNQKDNHYYPKEVVAEAAPIWRGVKMYATDHREDEKSILTEVSEVVESPVGYTDDGAPVARAAIIHPQFAEIVRMRHKAGLLGNLHCSIVADGTVEKDEYSEDGRTGRRVKQIHAEGAGIDWVTRAGRGGHALALSEIEQDDGGGNVTDEEKVKAQEAETTAPDTETVRLREQDDEEQPGAQPEAALPGERVQELLAESGLGEEARGWLALRPYENEEELSGAIAEMVAWIKKISGSGKPFAQGGSAPAQAESMEERERRRLQRFAEIGARHGRDYSYVPVALRESE